MTDKRQVRNPAMQNEVHVPVYMYRYIYRYMQLTVVLFPSGSAAQNYMDILCPLGIHASIFHIVLQFFL